jgi:hypothetical protein
LFFFFFDQNKTRIKNIHWFGAEGNRIYLINELIVGLLLGCISISGAEEDENEKQYKKPPETKRTTRDPFQLQHIYTEFI